VLPRVSFEMYSGTSYVVRVVMFICVVPKDMYSCLGFV